MRTEFSFGKNWLAFIKHLDEHRIEVAQKALVDLAGSVKGTTFLDIGCGSGLSSLAAFRAGASRIVSVDVDRAAVECTKNLKAEYAPRSNWTILSGSILDRKLVKKLRSADVVYSWGVLHHSGHMWLALSNTCSLVSPGGRMAIAIYNKSGNGWKNLMWQQLKLAYNRGGAIIKELMFWCYAAAFFAYDDNPVRTIRQYRSRRGMRWADDVRDWLGGYPYEFATAGEVVSYCENLDFKTLKVADKGGMACNEFLFQKRRQD